MPQKKSDRQRTGHSRKRDQEPRRCKTEPKQPDRQRNKVVSDWAVWSEFVRNYVGDGIKCSTPRESFRYSRQRTLFKVNFIR
jgi:hypothetical protein